MPPLIYVAPDKSVGQMYVILYVNGQKRKSIRVRDSRTYDPTEEGYSAPSPSVGSPQAKRTSFSLTIFLPAWFAAIWAFAAISRI